MVRGRRLACLTAAALLLSTASAAALSPLTSAAGAADAPDVCAIAQADFDARRIEQALAAYDGDAKQCPERDTNVAQLNQQREIRARELATAAAELQLAKEATESADKAGHRQLARLAYVRALAADATSAKAIDGLAALAQTPGTDPFAGSWALYEAGLKAEAKAQLVKEITDGNALGDSARDQELATLLHGKEGFDKFRADGEDFIDNAKWVLTSLAWIAGVLIGVVLFVFLVRVTVNFWVLDPWRRRKKQREAKPRARWLRRHWRALTQPRLNVQAADGDEAKALTARVRTAILGLDHGVGTSDLRMASVPEERLDLASLGEIDARVKPLLLALELGSRRDTVTVSLSTAEDGGTHTRVSGEAFARKSRRRSATFVAKAADGQVTGELVGRAVAWTLFSAEAMRPRLRDGDPTKKTYGTESVDSYGCFLGAREAIDAGDIDAARSLLVKAVEADPEFVRAQLNLGVTETMDSDRSVRRLGMARLRALIAEGS